MDYTKPLPAIDVWSRPFWDGTREGRLQMQSCNACGHVFFPPGPVCPACQSKDLAWKELSGRGKIESWVVFHQLYYKGFAADIPYNVAMIRLEEGATMFSNVVGIPNAELHRDMPVEVVFERATDEITIPKFKPQPAGGA